MNDRQFNIFETLGDDPGCRRDDSDFYPDDFYAHHDPTVTGDAPHLATLASPSTIGEIMSNHKIQSDS